MLTASALTKHAGALSKSGSARKKGDTHTHWRLMGNPVRAGSSGSNKEIIVVLLGSPGLRSPADSDRFWFIDVTVGE